MPANPKFTLAIETATQKGSLSLLKDGVEIGQWIGKGIGPGDKTVSVELLPQIAALLESNNLTNNNIDLLAVSAGPGSFTGVRVGLAAAKGLQMASGCAGVTVPLPEALARSVNTEKSVICLIPSGRNEAYWQEFNGQRAKTEVVSSKIEEIAAYIAAKEVYCVATSCLKKEYIEQIESRAGNKVNIASDDLAKYIAMAGLDKVSRQGGSASGTLSPMYVKSFNAGR